MEIGAKSVVMVQMDVEPSDRASNVLLRAAKIAVSSKIDFFRSST